MNQAATMPLPDEDDSGDEGAPMAQASAQGKKSSSDRLEAIVALQQFSGQWEGTEELLTLLGLDKQAVAAKIKDLGLMDKGDDVIATALVLAYLQTQLGERKDEWEMMAEKAKLWLKDQGVDFDALL